jgi:hypothetical protein
VRTFYDAITPANIPANAQGVAGYVDGRYAWKAADWARFPHAVKARIAVFSSTNDGHVLDVEPGCSTPANAPGWVVRRRAAGVDPTVYCSLSAWPTVRAAFHNAGVAEPHWWVAAYPGNGANLYPGAIAHQYADPGPVDISVVADYWPGVDPTPVRPKPVPIPTPAPTPSPFITPRKATMLLIRSATNPTIYVTDGFEKRWAGNAVQLHDLLAMAGQTGPVVVSQATVDAIPDAK